MKRGTWWALTVVAVMALLPWARAGWAFEKLECVKAHEQSQELWQSEQLVASREQLLICVDASCPTLIRDDCVGWLSRMNRKLQEESRASREPGGGPGRPVAIAAPEPASVPAPVPAAAAASSAAATPAAAALPFTAEEAAPPAARVARERDRSGGDSAPARWQLLRSPVVTGAVSAAALVSGAFFGLRGLSEADRLRQSCAPSCDPGEVSTVRRQLIVADALAVVGVGFGAVTAWMLWDRASPVTKAADHGPGASAEGLSATVTRNGVRLHYARHF